MPEKETSIIGVDYAEQESEIPLSLVNTRGRFFQVVPIQCETCHRPFNILILNKKTNKWNCVGCCSLTSL
jgi:hypothetical protein